jgi:hypothetical protein
VLAKAMTQEKRQKTTSITHWLLVF